MKITFTDAYISLRQEARSLRRNRPVIVEFKKNPHSLISMVTLGLLKGMYRPRSSSRGVESQSRVRGHGRSGFS